MMLAVFLGFDGAVTGDRATVATSRYQDVFKKNGIVEVTIDLPNFQAPTVFLLLYDDLLRWTLLVLHLFHSMISASQSLPKTCI